MNPRKTPYGDTILVPGTPEQADDLVSLLVKRARFVHDECVRRGWPTDPTQLSFKQLFEIRDMPGWKDPK